MNRDQIAVSLLPSLLAGAFNLGAGTEEERKEVFSWVAKITYEIADEMINASKEPPKTN